MEPMELMQLVTLVAPAPGEDWGTRTVIMARLAGQGGGAFIDGGEVASWAGCSRAAGGRALRALEAARVIIRDRGPGGRARRPFVVANPNWRAWRVEWRIPKSAIDAQLALAREERNAEPLERLFARSMSARSRDRIARSMTARMWLEDALEQRAIARSGARDSAPVDDSNRALQGARFERLARAAIERAHRHGAPEEGYLLGADDQDSSSSALEPQRLEEEGRQQPGWVKVRAAYASAAGVRVVYGAPEAALARLVALHGVEPVLQAIDQAPIELGVKLLAPHLGEVLAHPGEQVASVTPIDLESRRRGLEQIVATYRAEGAEPPGDLLAALARWQDDGANIEHALEG